MVTLSAANSVFQLAVGVNSVMPVLLSNLEQARIEAAESLLRKFKERFPEFEVREKDRHFFVAFTASSIKGFKYAKITVRVIACVAIFCCSISLAALYWSSISPEKTVSIGAFKAFFGLTLVAAPIFYIGTTQSLKWLCHRLAADSVESEAEMKIFKECFVLSLQVTAETANLQRVLEEAQLAVFKVQMQMQWIKLNAWLSNFRRRKI